ncbi:MAG: hypothetical protein IPP99_05025 [Chitinophagaceae bacterium]|nr:hypothetical protein [Chitinophagaceae bacterium]
MTKFVSIPLLFLLLSLTAFSQRNGRILSTRTATISTWERLQLQRNVLQLRTTVRRAERDGVMTTREKRRIRQLKAKTRRDAIRFRYQQRGRMI